MGVYGDDRGNRAGAPAYRRSVVAGTNEEPHPRENRSTYTFEFSRGDTERKTANSSRSSCTFLRRSRHANLTRVSCRIVRFVRAMQVNSGNITCIYSSDAFIHAELYSASLQKKLKRLLLIINLHVYPLNSYNK